MNLVAVSLSILINFLLRLKSEIFVIPSLKRIFSSLMLNISKINKIKE
jgi:hypothetical protein